MSKLEEDFLSKFIQECISEGIVSSEEMVERAQALADDLTYEIELLNKKVEHRKQLIHSIAKLGGGAKTAVNKDFVKFLTIKDHSICEKICASVKSKPLNIENIPKGLNREDAIAYIKQMCSLSILHQSGNTFVRGDKFNAYCSFIGK